MVLGLSGGVGAAPAEASLDFIDGRRRGKYNFVNKTELL